MRMSALLFTPALLLSLAAGAQQSAPQLQSAAQAQSTTAAAPRPFVATYAVSYRGIGAGSITFRFSQEGTSNRYVFEIHPHPNALARLFISRSAVERSVMQIGPEPGPHSVQPLRWILDDGKSGNEKDGQLQFDWAGGLVTGEVEGRHIELPIEPGLQDRSSIQISVSTSLLRGVEPGTIPMIDDDRIKRYDYVRKQASALDTKLGRLDTLVYESTRAGSSRMSRFWLVPELDFLPARAEQIRKGKLETVMTLTALERN